MRSKKPQNLVEFYGDPYSYGRRLPGGQAQLFICKREIGAGGAPSLAILEDCVRAKGHRIQWNALIVRDSNIHPVQLDGASGSLQTLSRECQVVGSDGGSIHH